MNEQTNYAQVDVMASGDVTATIYNDEDAFLAMSYLSSSAARKLAKSLLDAADAAEKQDALNRRRDRLAVQEARLIAQLAELQAKAAALA